MTPPIVDKDLSAAHVVIVGPDGQPIASADEANESSVTDLVEQPAKVMRIGTMIKQLLEEVRAAPLDDAPGAAARHPNTGRSGNWRAAWRPELREELERLSLPFGSDVVPTDSELRIAQAQLVGWLEGLFHGIQTALFAQQMAARAQFEQMRRAAITAGPEDEPTPSAPDGHRPGLTGPYL